MKKYISREIENLCLKHLKSGLVTAIVGARQVGKTTLLLKLKEIISEKGIIPANNIFYYSFDDPIIRSELNTDFRFLEKDLEKLLGKPIIKVEKPILLIIDEAQKAPIIFDWLKIVFDQYPDKIKIIISGSSSPGIRKKSIETLAGRINFLKLYPFTLRELIKDLTEVSLPEPLWNSMPKKKIMDFLNYRQSLLYKHKNIINNLLERVLIEGTLPGVYTASSIDEKYLRLSSMVNTYLERDVRALGEIGNIDDYLNLLKTLSFEVGSIVNLSSISKDLGIAYNTVRKYISILRNTFILNSVLPLFRRARRRFVKSNKMYFFDIGVANYLAKRTLKEHIRNSISGFLFENILIKTFESENENRIVPKNFFFWRDYNGHEIDLVVENHNKQYIPVEISLSKTIPKKKKRNFSVFFNEFKNVPYGIFLYKGDVEKGKINGKTVYFIPWWLWC